MLSLTRCLSSRLALCALLAATSTVHRANIASAQQPAQHSVVEQPDKYTWLEDIYGEKQLAWVKSEDQRTANVIEKDPRWATNRADALMVLDSPERLAIPSFRNGAIYNTWRDADHVRGIIRRTTLEDYKSADPKWQTVVDYDALSKADNKSWVGKGAICLEPDQTLCLLALSNGGEDAITVREIDLNTGKFVDGGFVLPTGKNRAAWVDKDTLLIGRDWGPGSMSEAGYPITVREWKRGEPLEKAREVFRGDVKDNGYGDNAEVLKDGQGHQVSVVERSISTFERETYLLEPSGPVKLALPLKGGLDGLLDGQLLVSIDDDWTPTGSTQTYVKGSELSLDLKATEKDPIHLKPTVIFAPTATEFQEGTSTTKNRLLITTLDNVQGRAYIYTHSHDGKWTRKRLPVADNSSVSLISTSEIDDRFFLTVFGFLTPPSILLGDAADGSLFIVKSQKPLFDASADTVQQLHATSKDGTSIPYFIVHRKDIKYDGSNPTLLNAYGGFQIAETPNYSSVIGKLWLEHGGVFVLANIRGGGEFGPAWHEAGLKTHRQRIYDDFYAVAQDLIARKITSTQKLGIMGGSNGGLLMGVEFTQHPEMWKAVVIQVPLLDMLAFEHLSAGASWVGEYGSASVPEERAFLASISPYNQLKPGVKYPEPLIFTTTKDDRVGPVHARKFAARMEEFGDPFFYDEITEGGHGAGADNKQASQMWADTYTYLMMKLMD